MTVPIQVMMLAAALFLPRLVIKIGDGRELTINFLVTCAGLALLALTGQIRARMDRLVLFGAMAAVLTLGAIVSALVSDARSSPTSFALMLILYAGWIFVTPSSRENFRTVATAFRTMALVISVAGIVQFFAQFVIPGPTLFTFDGIVPRDFLALHYNYLNQLPGLPLYKSNGFFLLEASHLSQVMALAVLVELIVFRPSWRLLFFGAAMVVSYSGTGMLLLAIVLPIVMFRRTTPSQFFGLLGLLAFLFTIALLFGDALYLSAFTDRLGEFEGNNTSAFARFLSPLYLMYDFSFDNGLVTLFGMGPGAIESFTKVTDYLVHDPTWGKLAFEYGVAGFFAVMTFVLVALFRHPRSTLLNIGLFVHWLLLGGFLLDPRLQAEILCLGTLHPGDEPGAPEGPA